jgi:rfaE bifunctional protein kinase chain/domain
MSVSALTTEVVQHILQAIPRLTVAVVGDLYLDRYLHLDGTLTEPSLETGLDAYQVVRVQPCPGAAGTVINNLVALGAGTVRPVSVIGRDGEGLELRQALEALGRVRLDGVQESAEVRTPTYTKPMLHQPGQAPRELNRLDIHNRRPLPAEVERRVLHLLEEVWRECDAVVILDQVSGPDGGVVTAGVRERAAQLGLAHPGRWVLADSRARVGLFRGVCVKPNARECLAAAGGEEVEAAARALARQAGRPVFCTRSEDGILLVEADGQFDIVPGYPVAGPIDPVGAGDSTSAGIVCALAAGASPREAAAFGNLVASITVAKLGTTGTATPDEVRRRWAEVGVPPA